MEGMNLIGKTFHRWEVIGIGKKHGKNKTWLCRCQCGTIREVIGYNLISGKSSSCGCLQKERAKSASKTHGLSKTRIYGIYKQIKGRCGNPLLKAYQYYGAKGVKLCKEWDNDFLSFYNWAMANGYDDSLSIDRIDVNGNYEPNNCRWVDILGQANNKTTTLYLRINNEKHSVADWGRIKNTNKSVLYSKIQRLIKQLDITEDKAEICIYYKRTSSTRREKTKISE